MTATDRSAELLSRLLEGLLDDPRRLELDATPLPRRVNWRVKVSFNDAGKLCGKGGEHIKSLIVLVRLLGERHGEQWILEVLDPDQGERVENLPIPDAPAHLPGESLRLLYELLAEILTAPAVVKVTQTGGKPLVFNFEIRPANVQDYELLVTAVPVQRTELTPVAALGTLFRALGRQQGVSYRVEVPGR